jgi:Putative Flp pilus-assembly TadE/G-like
MRRKSEAGQALAVTVVAMVALIGFAGLGVDMGMLRYEKRLQQNAADAAAIAGANNIPYGGITVGAQNASAANKFTDSGGGEVSDCGSGAAVGTVCVQVNSTETTGGPQSGPHANDPNYVEVLVAAVQPTYFMRILGIRQETVTARAVATNVGGGGCLYTLGRPGSPTDVSVTGGSINAPNCGILDDGDLNAAGGTVTARSVGVAGACGAGCPGNAILGIPVAADPLSSLVALLTSLLPGGPCQADPNLTADGTLNPGNYCAITISGAANVTFNPGVYTIVGNFTSSTSGTLTGTGVTFAITTGAINITGTGILNLSAPTTGSFTGILFWQAATDVSAGAFSVANGSSLGGALYLPAAALTMTMSGSNSVVPDAILVVNSLTVSGGGTLTLSASGASNSPIKTTTLVE